MWNNTDSWRIILSTEERGELLGKIILINLTYLGKKKNSNNNVIYNIISSNPNNTIFRNRY